MSKDLERILKNIDTKDIEAILKTKEEEQINSDLGSSPEGVRKANSIIKQNQLYIGNSKTYRICGTCGQVNIDSLEVK